jgi:arginase family enzyme
MASRQTLVKRLAYLGAAIREGQPIGGVEKGPELIRQSGLFSMLRKNYGAEVIDYGDVKLENEKDMHPPV